VILVPAAPWSTGFALESGGVLSDGQFEVSPPTNLRAVTGAGIRTVGRAVHAGIEDPDHDPRPVNPRSFQTEGNNPVPTPPAVAQGPRRVVVERVHRLPPFDARHPGESRERLNLSEAGARAQVLDVPRPPEQVGSGRLERRDVRISRHVVVADVDAESERRVLGVDEDEKSGADIVADMSCGESFAWTASMRSSMRFWSWSQIHGAASAGLAHGRSAATSRGRERRRTSMSSLLR
jgi:hypothetical protein